MMLPREAGLAIGVDGIIPSVKLVEPSWGKPRKTTGALDGSTARLAAALAISKRQGDPSSQGRGCICCRGHFLKLLDYQPTEVQCFRQSRKAFQSHRLHQKRVSSKFIGAINVNGMARTSEDDHLNAVKSCLLSNPGQYFKTRKARQLQIQKYQRRDWKCPPLAVLSLPVQIGDGFLTPAHHLHGFAELRLV